MPSTLLSDFKNLTVVLSPMTGNNNRKIILPYELDSLQERQNAANTINTYASLIFQLYLTSWKTWKSVRSCKNNFQGGVKSPTVPFIVKHLLCPPHTHFFMLPVSPLTDFMELKDWLLSHIWLTKNALLQ